jgi:predicted dehydrogenase
VGSKGKITFSVFGQYIKVNVDGKEETLNFEPLQHVEQPMIEQVVAYFRGEGENPCSAEEALKTMKIMDAFTNTAD